MTETVPAANELRGGEMSFLDHLDELRKRLVNSIGFIVLAFGVCWFLSGYIYDFLSIPIRRAISEKSYDLIINVIAAVDCKGNFAVI